MATRTDPNELLSTGEVARILGSSVQHVVDLCRRGEMPYTMIGTHRRIRLSDAEALSRRSANNAGGPMTRDQLRALWLHRAIAAKVAADPTRVLAQAKSTANSLLDREPDGAPWLRQWLALLREAHRRRDPDVPSADDRRLHAVVCHEPRVANGDRVRRRVTHPYPVWR